MTSNTTAVEKAIRDAEVETKYADSVLETIKKAGGLGGMEHLRDILARCRTVTSDNDK